MGYFVTQNLVKASYAERAIKTIKSRIAQYMTHGETHRWIDVLPKITKSYNGTYHLSIRRTPASVTHADSVKLWKLQYEPVVKQIKPKTTGSTQRIPRKYKLKVGDLVGISFLRRPFQRQYDERWTRELFVVTERFLREGIPQYKLKDYLGDVITGTFNQNQLNKAYEQDVYKVETVVKRRGRTGKKEYLIRWKEWGPKYDSWISEEDFRSIQK